jgi:hypothetical protein
LESGLPNATVIASGDVLDLHPDEAPRTVALKSPGVSGDANDDGEGQDESGGDGAPADEDPKPPASVDVTHGLVFRITNAKRPQEVWTKWVEIVPLRPTSYVDFEGSVAGREIHFTAGPADADLDGQVDLPPEIGEKPVTVVVRGDGTVFPAASIVPDAFNAVKRSAQLTIQPLEEVRGRPTVALDVDGFPRAVAWRVDFESQRVDQIRNPASVRIERVGMGAADPAPPARLYRRRPYVEHPPIDDKVWPVVVDVGQDPVCAFDVSRGVRPLKVRLRVDAPLDAFNTVGGGNAVVLSWEGDVQAPTRIYDDRAVRSEFVAFTESGGMTIASTVDDLETTLEPPGVNNKAVWLTARLAVQGAPEQVDSLPIVFDGLPPKILSASVAPKIIIGTPRVTIDLAVSDLSGVAKVEAWLSDKLQRNLDELDPKAAESLQLPDPGPYRPEGEQERPFALAAKAPDKTGKYYMTLRVTDRSGQWTTTLGQELSLVVADPPLPPEPGPVVGDLKARVLLGSRVPPVPLTVKVKEQPGKSAPTDGQGRFTIRGLKAGTYTLIVEGNVNNRPVAAEEEITLEEPADYEWKYTITAAWKLAEPQKE